MRLRLRRRLSNGAGQRPPETRRNGRAPQANRPPVTPSEPQTSLLRRMWSPRSLLILGLLLFGNYALFTAFVPDRPGRTEIPYTVFKQQIEAANVAEVTSRADVIQGTFKRPVPLASLSGDPAIPMKEFSTVRPA